MQYRAIGLVRGIYSPSEEQFNRGLLTTEDGTSIDSVLLGRITSLVKKHLTLETPHQWVVYPRTRTDDSEDSQDLDLHLQIVGVWEPETLGLPGEDPHSQSEETASPPAETEEAASPSAETEEAASPPAETEEAASPSAETEAEAAPEQTESETASPEVAAVDDNYFSIRGEVIRYSEAEELIFIKILQGAKRSAGSQKAFRLVVKGKLEGKIVGYFWDLTAQRQGKTLMLQEATPVAAVPPKKKKRHSRGSRGKAPRREGPRSGASRPAAAASGSRPVPVHRKREADHPPQQQD
ncbi:uncharacterized protein XM38_043220 [Halomicronema hongdechloris C2206]|uniref:Uncharacterized protein n=1 Tax=Halomicronema hongdechloris C2206 TaxID=1641165 RepID=A0A1Z3HTB3_9CYAN|nr:hypothetical protein [Halomicronema hongdechloris]ASC73357.1 uncharacterized protein XM38_043220 [Halomicronema hongdechloris C2206]